RMFLWMQRQSTQARLRGWASVLHKCGWRSWPHWLRWARLAQLASPRYWIYDVATELFFRLPALAGEEPRDGALDAEWKSLARRLPLPDDAALQPGGAQWRQLAKVTALNYRHFLEVTAA